MPEDKVKAAESERIEVSSLLSIDSPMIIWHTDLEALGLGGGGHSGSSTEGGSSESGGTSGGEPTSGESTSGAGEPVKLTVSVYIATCDAVAHPLELEGAVDDGRWFGSFQDRYLDAQAQAQAHADGLAYVGIYTNGVLVGPVVQL